MTKNLRSLIPLLTISRNGIIARFAAWPESIRSRGEQYQPFPFMFVLDEWDRLVAWKRVEIHLDHSVLAAQFPTPFPGEGAINASVQVVTEHDREHVLEQFDGTLMFDRNTVYFVPAPKT